MIVDIICSAYNGARYLPELLRSLRGQTHVDWRLWARDDGSSDETLAILRVAAEEDPRVRLPDAAGTPRLGATQGFAWLLERVPSDSGYVMFADQDDVWLPHKIDRTFAAMIAAESVSPGAPVLAHTDLTVTDERLNVIHPSFWAYAGLDPNATTLRRIVVQNVTTGAATMINRPLRERAGRIPGEAAFHDWWCALVAAAFGRIVAVPEATILYRQHGANVVGARDASMPLRRLPGAVISRLANVAEFRRGLSASAAQAGAFLERFRASLSESDRDFLERYAKLPSLGFARRKLDLLRLRTFPEHGLARTLGVLLRG